ncbi:MAG TPA: hypothetical protein VFV72_02120 [Candidatus Limnocylindrales bacterium]|nr:hypothetical protein [Candidatus Limnocylindrales bacterium]
MTDRLTLELLSQADLASPDRLEAIGAALDADPGLRPERAGPRDPPKTEITSVARHLAAWNPPQVRGRRDDQFLARDTPREGTGILSLAFAPWPRKLWLSYDADGLDEAGLDAIAALVKRLADAMNAFYGYAALSSVLRQEAAFREAARRAGGFKPNLGSGPYFVSERGIGDVYWLNYFGPATVAKWGTALAGLGVRREATAVGGALVWATPTPFVLDPEATAMTAYPWKKPFYDALGLETFIHEGWQDPGVGVRVPSFEEHRQAIPVAEPG